MVTPGFKPFSAIFFMSSLLLGCATQSTSPESGDVLAFVSVTVIPMDSERVEADQTVIVRDGRIDEIGPATQIEVPDGAVVIDGSGKYLMPGLADMHVHLDSENPGMLRVLLANGVTTVRNLSGTPEILEWREHIQDGRLIGPRIYTTGPIADGDPPMWPTSSVVTTPEQAASEVVAQKQAGYDGIKVLENLLPEVYEAILRTAREQGLPVYGHVPWRVGLQETLDGDQKSLEHMNNWMRGLLPSAARDALIKALTEQKMSWPSYFVEPARNADETRIAELVARSAAADVWFCPTLVTERNYSSDAAEFEALRNRDTMQYVGPSQWTEWNRIETTATSERGDPEAMKKGFAMALGSVQALHEAGVHMIVGTDSPSLFVVPGFSVQEELANFIEAGFTPFETIAAATRDTAQFLGASEEFGTVAVGRRADLILVEGNPLEDVGSIAHRVGVSARGRWFSEADLRGLLEQVARDYRELNLQSEAANRE